MELQREIQTLTRLGLTNTQAKVYLTLATSGLVNAEVLSQKSGVARPEIYRIMLTLARIGLIEEAISIPRKFKAVSISQGVSTLMAQRKKETMELETESKELIAKFKNKEVKEAFEQVAPQFIMIPKKRANVEKRLVLIQNALNSIEVITLQNRVLSYPQSIVEELAAALRRKVKMRFIMDKPKDGQVIEETVKKFIKTGNFEVRYILGPPHVVLTIYDKKEALITTSAEAAMAESPALWTNNYSLVITLQEYFETLWLKSIKWHGTN